MQWQVYQTEGKCTEHLLFLMYTPGLPDAIVKNPERFLASFKFFKVRFFNQSINFVIRNLQKIYFIRKKYQNDSSSSSKLSTSSL